MSDQGVLRRVRSGDHLTQIGDIWYYLRIVPPDVRDAFGKTKVKKSLHTSSHSEAKRLEKIEDVEFEEKLQRARHAGPDGLPRDQKARTEALVDRVYAELNAPAHPEEELPTRLEELIAKVPVKDRQAVIDHIEEAEDAGMAAWEKVDQFWEEELRDRLFASALDVDDWQVKRQEIVALIANQQKQAVSEHTLAWAYVQWKNGGSRPPQTEKDTSDYLDDFQSATHVRMLSAVRRSHLLYWRKLLAARGTPEAPTIELRRARKLSNKTVNHHLELVSAVLRTGWRDAEMAAPDLSKINLAEESTGNRGAWSREELLKALGELEPNSGQAWLFVIGLTTSTRMGETCAMIKKWYNRNGFIEVPKQYTKMKKPHVVPIIEMIREPFLKIIEHLKDDDYMFDLPRPSNPKLKISHEASKWFSRFHEKHHIPRVMHELRHSWIAAARYDSPVKEEVWEIISGHSKKTVADGYGGEKPLALMAANETICGYLLDEEMRSAILRLVAKGNA